MLKYIVGLVLNIFNHGVSILALIDYKSDVSSKARINRHVKIYNSNVGNYSYVGSKSELINADIGKFCSIAQSCSIGLASHTMNNISTSPIFTEKKNGTGHSWTSISTPTETNRCIIGNDVWIGIRVIIKSGITIGDGAIIGAGSIVTKDVPAYAIAVGSPAKVIKYRFENSIIEKLLEIKWWNLPESTLKKNIEVFQKQDFNLEEIDNFKL